MNDMRDSRNYVAIIAHAWTMQVYFADADTCQKVGDKKPVVVPVRDSYKLLAKFSRPSNTLRGSPS